MGGKTNWRNLGRVGVGAGVALFVLCRSLVIRNKSVLALNVFVFATLAAMIATACWDLAAPQLSLSESIGFQNPAPSVTNVESPSVTETAETPIEVDWSRELMPNGTSTRLGSAIQFLVNRERGGPIAGIVVITDGRNNAGLEPSRALAAASNANIPIYTVGIGSSETPKNVQIVDIQAPPRVFPGDKFRVKGLIQSFGLAGKQCVSICYPSTKRKPRLK